MRKLKTINVPSGKLVVSEFGDCAQDLTGVRRGKWDAYVIEDVLKGWGARVFELHLYHQDVHEERRETMSWTELDYGIGVDTGCVQVWHDENEHVSCNSGLGDGSYPIYVSLIANQPAAIKIVFIANDEDENESDYDEDEEFYEDEAANDDIEEEDFCEGCGEEVGWCGCDDECGECGNPVDYCDCDEEEDDDEDEW